MDERIARGLGALAVLGGGLSVVASIPSRWYGVPQTDAYVFDPATLSPLWTERTLMPLVGLLAGAMVLAGLAGLVVRDRPVAGRLRRWSGYAVVVGLGLVEVTLVLFALVDGAAGGAGGLTGAVLVVVAALAGLAGLVVLVPALVALGVGYARTDRPTVGYALVGGTALAVLAAAVTWVRDPATGFGSLPVVVPFVTGFVAAGAELWSRAAPLPEPGTPGGASAPDRDGDDPADDAPADDVAEGDTDGTEAATEST